MNAREAGPSGLFPDKRLTSFDAYGILDLIIKEKNVRRPVACLHSYPIEWNY